MDDGSPIGLLILFLACMASSFYFSGTETALASVSRVRMRALADEGDRRAARVLSILDNFDRALTTILIGNNIVNISMVTIATIVATDFFGPGAVALATVLVTVLVFLFAETLPKTFAKANSERFAMAVGGSLQALMRVLSPLAAVFSAITGFLARPFRRGEAGPTVTEEELRDIIEDAVEDGALNEETGALVRSAMVYTGTTVRDILTPWKDVSKLPLHTGHEQVLAILRDTRHSRLPIIDETGTPVGLLRVRRYLKATLGGHVPPSLAEVMEPIHSIPVTVPADDLLPMMSEHKTHFTLVRDEWDNVVGVVTMEDILEALVGDIWDEDDLEEGVY